VLLSDKKMPFGTEFVIAETPPGSNPSSLPGFHILVPVWGAAYCDLFTNVSLPSQLADGNLPSLPHKDRCLYHVLTLADDQPRIEASEAWQRLKSLMPVRVEIWNEHERTPHETMSACLRRGITFADRHDAASLFFNPDLVFADGAVDAMVKRVGAGHRVIFTTGIRLLKQTVVPEIERHRQAGKIVVAPHELVAIAMRNLHPISRQNFWIGDTGTLLPATLFWPVADEGLLARCFHLHPLLVWPQNKNVVFDGTVDDDFVSMACPNNANDHIVIDSDELLMCEISDFSRTSETSYRRGSISDAVDWAESRTDERHRRLATFPIRFHSKPATENLWATAEAEADRVMTEVLRRLEQNSWQVALQSPMRLLRRWVRVAATASTTERNRHNEGGWCAPFARGYLDVYRRYGAFCASYERFRGRLDHLLFGSADHPYPWGEHAFTIARPVRAALSLLPVDRSQTLIIAPQADVARRLARAIGQSSIAGWPQAGIAAATPDLERWPYDSGAFNLVMCIGALDETPHPDAFLSELARVTKQNGRAIIIVTSAADHHDISSDCVSSDCVSYFKIERRLRVGGIGSLLAERFHRWSERRHRLHRISPVILEIPLLPFLLAARLLAEIVVAVNARLLDFVDYSGRYHTHIATLLIRRDHDQSAR
jgi:hypothetical protein